MNTTDRTATAALRGLLCAGLSTAITAFFSWSFVASTDTLDWMGSSALHTQEIAMISDQAGPAHTGDLA